MVNNQPVAALHFIQLLLQSGTLLLLLLQLPLHHTELLLSFTLNVIGDNHCSLQVSLETPPLLCVLLERAIRTPNCCKNAPTQAEHLVIEMITSNQDFPTILRWCWVKLSTCLFILPKILPKKLMLSFSLQYCQEVQSEGNEDIKDAQRISALFLGKHNDSIAIKAQLSFVWSLNLTFICLVRAFSCLSVSCFCSSSFIALPRNDKKKCEKFIKHIRATVKVRMEVQSS